MIDDRPYTILSPTKIRLSLDAKHWAHEYGMSVEEFARYLLHQHRHSEFESVETPAVSVQVSTSPMASYT
jgi:hypothetical protein